MNRVKRYGNYLVWGMIVLYVIYLVRCVPANWWFKRIYKVYPEREFSRRTQKKIRKVEWFVRAIQNTIKFEFTCLEKSIAKQKILTTQGIFVNILFGVLKEDNAIGAHAWNNKTENVNYSFKELK